MGTKRNGHQKVKFSKLKKKAMLKTICFDAHLGFADRRAEKGGLLDPS